MKNKRFVIAATVAAIGTASGIAAAYAEGFNQMARAMVLPFTGCMEQQSGLQHGGENDPITAFSIATPKGMTANFFDVHQCNADWPAGTGMGLIGDTVLYLIKLNSTGVFHDDYSICKTVVNSNQTQLVPQLSFTKVWPTPPCGKGWYALGACLINVTMFSVPPGKGYIAGSFSAANNQAACNISPNWHPVGVADPTTMGPPVKL